MDRRSFLRSAGAAGVAAVVSTAEAQTPKEQTRRQAKVGKKSANPRQAILIMTDATRKDMLNCYQLTGLQTPNLDRIAEEGVRFERAYTTQPVCTPARSALFTGIYPHGNGCWGNSMPLGANVRTVAEYLSDAGVACGYIGKWHLDGFDYFGTGKAAPGWDSAYWYDQRDYLEELTPEERRRSRDEKTSQDPGLEAGFTFAHRVTNRALKFVEEHRDQDFVLVVSYDEPHDPSIAPEKYRDLYREYGFPRVENWEDTLATKPEEQRIWAGGGDMSTPARAVREPDLFGALTFVDSEIGRVIDQVDKLTPGALMMYTSDHGGMLQSHHLYGKGPAMYEEITNIPFVVRWKGHTPKNVASRAVVSHIDLTGTLLEFFDHPLPKVLDGGSMLATFKNPQHGSRENSFIEWGRYEVDHDGFGGFQPIRCVCDGRYKLSIHLLTSDELYDLKTDPGEMHNLIESTAHAELRDRMHDTLLAWMDTSRDPFRGYYWGRRAWRKDYPVSWDNHGMTRQREDDGYLPRELDYDTGLPMTKANRPKGKGASK